MELSYIFLLKVFLYFEKGIFRTLVYSEPDTYSEHCQTSTIERFAKIATWRTFWSQPSKSFPKKLKKMRNEKKKKIIFRCFKK